MGDNVCKEKAKVRRHDYEWQSSLWQGDEKLRSSWRLQTGKKKDPDAPVRPPSACFLLGSERHPKIKSELPAVSTGDTANKLGETWPEQSVKDKQPDGHEAAELEEMYEKDTAAHRAQRDTRSGKKAPGRSAGSKEKKEPKEGEEEEEEGEEEAEDAEGERTALPQGCAWGLRAQAVILLRMWIQAQLSVTTAAV